MEIGDRLKILRKEKGVTQDEVASKTDLSRVTLGFYERNENQPTADALCAIAKYFGVTADYLLGLSDARQSENAILVKELGLTEGSVAVLRRLAVISALSGSTLYTPSSGSSFSFATTELQDSDPRTYMDILNMMLANPLFIDDLMPLLGMFTSPVLNTQSIIKIPQTRFNMRVEPCLRVALHDTLDYIADNARQISPGYIAEKENPESL